MPGIEKLHLSTILQTPVDFSLLNKCKGIKALSLYECSGPLETSLNNWISQAGHALEDVTFTDCPDIKVSTLETLARYATGLTQLSLNRCCQLDGSSLALVCRLPLKFLHLNGIRCDAIDIKNNRELFMSLDELCLSDNELSSEACDAVAETCFFLRRLYLAKNTLSYSSLVNLVLRQRRLYFLDLTGVPLSDYELIELRQINPHLTIFHDDIFRV